MPGMNGKEFAKLVKKLRPDTKVLYISGYSGDALAADGADNEEDAASKAFFAGSAFAEDSRRVGRVAHPAFDLWL